MLAIVTFLGLRLFSAHLWLCRDEHNRFILMSESKFVSANLIDVLSDIIFVMGT